jgi:hypothetical protein
MTANNFRAIGAIERGENSKRFSILVLAIVKRLAEIIEREREILAAVRLERKELKRTLNAGKNRTIAAIGMPRDRKAFREKMAEEIARFKKKEIKGTLSLSVGENENTIGRANPNGGGRGTAGFQPGTAFFLNVEAVTGNGVEVGGIAGFVGINGDPFADKTLPFRHERGGIEIFERFTKIWRGGGSGFGGCGDGEREGDGDLRRKEVLVWGGGGAGSGDWMRTMERFEKHVSLR